MKDVKSQLSILDEIMKLCESATVKPLQKKSTSVMAILEPEEDESAEHESADASPLDSMEEEAETDESETQNLKDKLGDMDLEDLKALYAKLK